MDVGAWCGAIGATLPRHVTRSGHFPQDKRQLGAGRDTERFVDAAQVETDGFGAAPELLRDVGDELAFYDALEVNDSAVKMLGDEMLRAIARELVDTVRRNATIDWMMKESVRAKMRVIVRRILRKNGYPPDKQEAATTTVLQQAELLSEVWSPGRAA